MEKTYGPKVVCRSVGISLRQLGYWTLIGVIKPTKQTHGSKIFNRYTEQDIETLRRVKQLTEEGFFVSKAAEKVHKEIVQTDLHSDGKTPGVKPAFHPFPQQEPLLTHSTPNGLASSLYLEVRLNEALGEVEQHPAPLSCMAIRIFSPAPFSLSPEKSKILLQVAEILISRKEASDVISYKKDATFLWLLPNRTLEQARRFSKEIKKVIEDREWTIQNKKFNLKASFGFGSYTFSSEKEGGILAEAELDLNRRATAENMMVSMRNGTDGSYTNGNGAIGKNRPVRH